MMKAYKYRFYPTVEQEQKLASFFGSCRFVYNLGLETKIQAWTSAKKNYTCIDLANQMKILKDTEATWLADCPSQSLQMSLRNLDNAYTKFFKGGGFPKFKNKYSKQSIQFPQGVKVDFKNSTIFLPKFHTVAKGSTDNALASNRMFLLYGYLNAATKMARVESYFRILCLEFSAFFQQPESFYLFLAKNRVVFMSFLRMKKESLWLKFIQY